VGDPDGTERELTASSDVSSSSLQLLFLGLYIILEQWFRDSSSHLLTRAAFIVSQLTFLPPLQHRTCLSGFELAARPSLRAVLPSNVTADKRGDPENYEFVPRVQNGVRLRSKHLLARLSLPRANPPSAL